MLTENLFRRALIEPANDAGVNRLQIVSGFATAGMADRHMEHLADLKKQFKIELIVGMTRHSGIEKAQHLALQKLVKTQPYKMDFSCRYIAKGNPVHAKTYCWFKNDQPYTAFSGSANYTLTAFEHGQIETLDVSDSNLVADFYANMKTNTDDCMADDIADHVALIETRQLPDTGGEKVTLSLLDSRTGKTPERSGINWGQRKGRNKDQAYINIPAPIRDGDFFPERAEQFTILTDDGDSFIMVRAQDGGKALETKHSNALLGEYFRRRIGIPPKTYVTRDHLMKYGRTDVTFIKIDEETYLMDFKLNM